MEKNEFFISSVNCAIFFGHPVLIDKKLKFNLIQRVSETCGELLDGEPTILPIPLDAPMEIPRLQLNSKDDSFSWGISMLRSDLRFNDKGEPNKKIADISEILFKNLYEIIILYTQEFNLGIRRVGFVANYIAELTDRTPDYITKSFLCNLPVFNSLELIS